MKSTNEITPEQEERNFWKLVQANTEPIIRLIRADNITNEDMKFLNDILCCTLYITKNKILERLLSVPEPKSPPSTENN